MCSFNHMRFYNITKLTSEIYNNIPVAILIMYQFTDKLLEIYQ